MKKAECQRIDVFELWCSRRLQNPCGSKEIKPVNPKRNQPWIFIGRTDSEADVPILWPPGVKSWLIGNDPGAGKDWGQEEKGMTEDEMIRWHHQLNGHEFKQTPDTVKDREAWCAAVRGGHKEWLNNNNICENCIIKKADSQRIDVFILWCWRKLLRVPWTEKRSNQSVLKKINPDYSLKRLMLKLKL